jgi:outer membrane PBP1 activator LpoA protein
MSKIFISYANSDRAYAEELFEALSQKSQEVVTDFRFASTQTLTPGEIRDALDAADAFVVLASDLSLQSIWVQTEIGAAWAASKDILVIVLPSSTDATLPPTLESARTYDARQKSPEAAADYIVRNLRV